jgi:hypothetical protein
MDQDSLNRQVILPRGRAMAQAGSRRPLTAEVWVRSLPIPEAARSKAWVYGRSFTGIVGSNPAEGMDVCVVIVVQGLVWIISDMKKDGRI